MASAAASGRIKLQHAHHHHHHDGAAGSSPSSAVAAARRTDYLRANRQAVSALAAAVRHRRDFDAEIEETARERDAWKMARFTDIRSRVAELIKQPQSPTSGDSAVPPAATSALASRLPRTPEQEEHQATQRDFLRRGALTRRVLEKGAMARLTLQQQQQREAAMAAAMASKTRQRCLTAPAGSSAGSSSTTTSSSKTSGSLKPPVPRAHELARLLPKLPRNHIVENRRALVEGSLAASLSSASLEDESGRPRRHSAYGRVPAYLMQRKREWALAEEEARAAQGDTTCPRGMRLLTEAERAEMLAALDSQEREVHRLLLRIPLRVDTPSMARRKGELEAQLSEIGQNRALFTRPKVFIKLDSGLEKQAAAE